MMSDFFTDSFFSQCLALSCVFLLGLSFGSLFKLIFSLFRPRKQSRSSARFVFLCIFLTFAAIVYTILIFETKNVFPFSDFARSHEQYYFLIAGIFAFAVILSLFWKIMLPVSLVLYVGFSIFKCKSLAQEFGTQKNPISLVIEEKAISIEGKKIPKNPASYQFLLINFYSLPDTMMLPIRRNWFSFIGIDEKSENSHEDENSVLVVPLPHDTAYPSLFSAHISFKNGKISCEVVRDL